MFWISQHYNNKNLKWAISFAAARMEVYQTKETRCTQKRELPNKQIRTIKTNSVMEKTSSLQRRKTKETTGSLILVQICLLMMTHVIKENSQDAQRIGHQSSKIHTQRFKVRSTRQPSLKSTKSKINNSSH